MVVSLICAAALLVLAAFVAWRVRRGRAWLRKLAEDTKAEGE